MQRTDIENALNTEHTPLLKSPSAISAYRSIDEPITPPISANFILQRIKNNHELNAFLTNLTSAQEYIKSAVIRRNKKRIMFGVGILTGLTAAGALIYTGTYLINRQRGYLHHDADFDFVAKETICKLSSNATNQFLDCWNKDCIKMGGYRNYYETSCYFMDPTIRPPYNINDCHLFKETKYQAACSLLTLPSECKNELGMICEELKAGTFDENAYVPYLIGAIISYAAGSGILTMPLFFMLWFICRNSSISSKLYQSLNYLLFNQEGADKLSSIHLDAQADVAYQADDIEKGLNYIRVQFIANMLAEQLFAKQLPDNDKNQDITRYLCRFFSPKDFTKMSLINRTTYEVTNAIKTGR